MPTVPTETTETRKRAIEAALNGHPESWRETIEGAVERAEPIIRAEERVRIREVLLDVDGPVLLALREEVSALVVSNGLCDDEGDSLGYNDPATERIGNDLSDCLRDAIAQFLDSDQVEAEPPPCHLLREEGEEDTVCRCGHERRHHFHGSSCRWGSCGCGGFHPSDGMADVLCHTSGPRANEGGEGVSPDDPPDGAAIDGSPTSPAPDAGVQEGAEGSRIGDPFDPPVDEDEDISLRRELLVMLSEVWVSTRTLATQIGVPPVYGDIAPVRRMLEALRAEGLAEVSRRSGSRGYLWRAAQKGGE